MAVFTNFAATLARQPSAASLAPRLNNFEFLNKQTTPIFQERYHSINIKSLSNKNQIGYISFPVISRPNQIE